MVFCLEVVILIRYFVFSFNLGIPSSGWEEIFLNKYIKIQAPLLFQENARNAVPIAFEPEPLNLLLLRFLYAKLI